MAAKLNFLFLDDSKVENLYLSNLIKMEELPIAGRFETHPGEALDYLRQLEPDQFPDVIMVDVNMPIMNGFEWAECYLFEFYLQHPKTMVFMLSSSPRLAMANELADNPVITDFLAKPFTKKVFDEKIYRRFTSNVSLT